MRYRLAALLAAIVVTPALAQISMQPMARPVTLPPAATIQQDPDAARKVQTLEDAQAQIAKLRADKRDLTQKLDESNAKLNETLATLDSWTKKGGSLVHAYCASDTLSQRSDGAGEQNCASSGYTCNAIDGMCRTSCTDSVHCASGYTCHMPGNYCENTAGGVHS